MNARYWLWCYIYLAEIWQNSYSTERKTTVLTMQSTPQRMLTHNFVVDNLIWPMPFWYIYTWHKGIMGWYGSRIFARFHFNKTIVNILYCNSPLNGCLQMNDWYATYHTKIQLLRWSLLVLIQFYIKWFVYKSSSGPVFELVPGTGVLTHLPLYKMATISQTTLSNAFFLNENVRTCIKISKKFVPKCSIDITWVLVRVVAWRRTDDKLLPEPMVT